MNRIRTLPLALLAIATLAAAPLQAAIIDVTVTGRVSSNVIGDPPLSGVSGGDGVTLSFTVDSSVFLNSASFPTRGYAIDPTSFSLTLGAATVGLQNPFPAGQTPYLVLRDNDPAVDGFFVSMSNVDWPVPLPLDQAGSSGQLMSDYNVTYTGDPLSSLDILDALGTYTLTGLTLSTWYISDNGSVLTEITFEEMTIRVSAVPEPATLSLMALGGLALIRRKSARSTGQERTTLLRKSL